MSAETLLSRLAGKRRSGDGRWLARCPAHEDRSPSLSIRETGDRVLLFCHAGCTAPEIVAAVGLTMADLFDGKPSSGKSSTPRVPFSERAAVIEREAGVAAVIGSDFLEHKEIGPTTWARLAQAVRRIADARAGRIGS